MRKLIILLILLSVLSPSLSIAGNQVWFGASVAANTAVGDKWLGLDGGYCSLSSGTGNNGPAVGLSGNITNFTINLLTAPGAGSTRTFALLKNGSATGLSVSYTGDSDSGIKSSSGSIAVTATDYIEFKSTVSGTTAAASQIYASAVINGSTAGEFSIGIGTYGTALSTTDTQEIGMLFNYIATVAQIDNVQITIPPLPSGRTLSITGLTTRLATSTGAGGTRTFKINKNGSPDDTISITYNNENGSKSATGSISVSEGDKICVESQLTGTPTASNLYGAIQFTSSVDGDFILSVAGNVGPMDPTNTTYTYTNSARHVGSSWPTDISLAEQISPIALTLKSQYYHLTGSPGGGSKQYAYTTMKNGVATALTGTLAGTTTVTTTTADVSLSANDLISIRSVPSNSPSSAYYFRSSILANSNTGVTENVNTSDMSLVAITMSGSLMRGSNIANSNMALSNLMMGGSLSSNHSDMALGNITMYGRIKEGNTPLPGGGGLSLSPSGANFPAFRR